MNQVGVEMKVLRSRSLGVVLAAGLVVFGLAACTPFGATLDSPI